MGYKRPAVEDEFVAAKTHLWVETLRNSRRLRNDFLIFSQELGMDAAKILGKLKVTFAGRQPTASLALLMLDFFESGRADEHPRRIVANIQWNMPGELMPLCLSGMSDWGTALLSAVRVVELVGRMDKKLVVYLQVTHLDPHWVALQQGKSITKRLIKSCLTKFDKFTENFPSHITVEHAGFELPISYRPIYAHVKEKYIQAASEDAWGVLYETLCIASFDGGGKLRYPATIGDLFMVTERFLPEDFPSRQKAPAGFANRLQMGAPQALWAILSFSHAFPIETAGNAALLVQSCIPQNSLNVKHAEWIDAWLQHDEPPELLPGIVEEAEEIIDNIKSLTPQFFTRHEQPLYAGFRNIMLPHAADQRRMLQIADQVIEQSGLRD